MSDRQKMHQEQIDMDIVALKSRLEKKNYRVVWLLVLFSAVCVIWFVVPEYLSNVAGVTGAEGVSRGVIGDSFGSVNALFAGLAFAGLIWTMVQTNIELRLQKEVVLLQIEELRGSTKSMKEQAVAQQDMTSSLVSLADATKNQMDMDMVIAMLGNELLRKRCAVWNDKKQLEQIENSLSQWFRGKAQSLENEWVDETFI